MRASSVPRAKVSNSTAALSPTLSTVKSATATGAAAGNGSPVCVRYRYSNPNTTALTRSINNARSLWYAQVSLRYEF